MGKSRSIDQQLIHSIADCSAIGESKRSYKGQHSGLTGYKIFSLGYRDDLKVTAKDLGHFIRSADPEIRMARSITREVLQEYLQSKADSGCTAEYLGKLKSHICKLEVCTAHTYGKTGWHADQLQIPDSAAKDKVRDKSANDVEYKQLLEVMTRPGCGEAWKALVLARESGLRVQEAACVRVGRLSSTGGRWSCGTITLQGKEDGAKGGRWRTVDILSPEALKRLKSATEGLQAGDRIISSSKGGPIDPDSLNTALSRAVKKCPEVAATWKKGNGFHAFRKAFAQECYDVLRSTGSSKKEAEDYSNHQLGHGSDRSDLTKVYILNRW